MGNGKVLRIMAMLLCIAFAACTPRRGTVDIVFVQTTDIHGHIYPDDPVKGTARDGALLKAATYIKGVRKKNKNVIYLDAGDNLQGSPEVYFDVTGNQDRPELVATILSELGCNASVPGNHDIAVGPLPYDRFINDATFPVLGGNIGYASYGDWLDAYTVIEQHGVRVAVIGLTTPASEYSVPSDIYGELGFADMVESASYWMNQVRENEKPDMVVGLFHSGLRDGRFEDVGVEEDAVLNVARNVPGFDVIFYGHDHEPYCDSVSNVEGNTVILVNPGPYCRRVANVKATVSFAKGNVTGKKFTASLDDVTGMEPDAKLAGMLAERKKEFLDYMDKVIGNLDDNIDSEEKYGLGSTETEFIHAVLSRHGGAQITLSTPPTKGEHFVAGGFTTRDAFRLYPYDNNMVSLMLYGEEVQRVLEYAAQSVIDAESEAKEHQSWDFYTAAGISYTVDCGAEPGKRVTVKGMSDGTAFNPKELYRVTVNSFMYCGGDSSFPQAVGLTRKQLARRLNMTSQADIRYYILTDFAVKKDGGRSVKVSKVTDFKYLGLR